MCDELQHYGTPRHSGRYPWGSGKNPQRSKNIISYVKEYKKLGMSEREIAEKLIGPGATSGQLRAQYTLAVNELRKENMQRAAKLKADGYGPTEIGRMMGENESTIRKWLKGEAAQKKNKIEVVADILKKNVDEKGYIDVGRGVELSLDTNSSNLKNAINLLKEQGYKEINVQVKQAGTGAGMKTTVKVLAPPGTTYKDVNAHKDQIRTVEDYIQENGKLVSRLGIPPINSVNSDRIMVRYEEDGGRNMDGVIQIRRGLADLNLGTAKYAQVRIPVDGTHYLKGMAVYGDDMPEGVDIIFNSNKSKELGKLGVMKEMKGVKETGVPDKENPFGATIKDERLLKRVPRYYIDENGKQQVSPINVVYEEGDWSNWSKKIASQMLSKQPISLIKRQLNLSYDIRKVEYDSIMAVSNPVVKRKLLEGFASDCDSTAVHLSAAALPRQWPHVLLPLPNIKEDEIYAPRYNNGEKVALIRYPHGGTFEIPILTVNNNNPDGKRMIGSDSPDAVGIHPSQGVRLSGADYDGDTVVVIPTNGDIRIKSTPPLAGLKGFDEKKDELYSINRDDPAQKNLPTVKKGSPKEQMLMGTVTNLITDMTLKGATDDELAAAVRHSMVVIDTAKHDLNYKQSEKDNHIADLKAKYQVQPNGHVGGASTIISRAKSKIAIDTRELDKSKNFMGWDPETGEVMYKDKKGDTYIKNGKVKHRQEWTTQMANTNDAYTLVSTSRTQAELAYANYANQLKSLANEARKEYLATSLPKRDPQAAKAYANEVASLNSKLNVALKNAPRERQAQLYADQTMEIKRKEVYPDKLDKDVDQKLRAQALAAGRAKFNANKTPVTFTAKEWEAVQARAISTNKLTQLLDNADLDSVKKLATPRQSKGLSNAQISLAKSMVARGYSYGDVAERLGVSASTIDYAVNDKG